MLAIRSVLVTLAVLQSRTVVAFAGICCTPEGATPFSGAALGCSAPLVAANCMFVNANQRGFRSPFKSFRKSQKFIFFFRRHASASGSASGKCQCTQEAEGATK
jgi:hypothetical protein